MPQKRFEEVCSCVGKAIKQVEAGSYAEYVIIIFEDNTYTLIEPVQIYEDLIVQSRPLDIVECADKELNELGIFSQEEIDEYIKEVDTKNKEMIEHREKEMLNYLQGKYKVSDSKYLRCPRCSSRNVAVICRSFNSDYSPSENSDVRCDECWNSGGMNDFIWKEEGED